VPVRVPSVEEEAIRDLVRAREDVRGDLMRWRQRLSKLLSGTGSSTRTRAAPGRPGTGRGSAPKISAAARRSRCSIISAIDTLELRRGQLETAIGELVPGSPYADTVARLRCLPGMDTLSAAGVAAEIGDLTRAQRARSRATRR
jgi:transposase